MKKKSRNKIFLFAATIFIILGGYFFLQNRNHIMHLTLTDRERLLITPSFIDAYINPLRESRTHLFEFRRGIYEISLYHYQSGVLVSEQILAEDLGLESRRDFLSIGAIGIDDNRIRLDVSGEWLSIVGATEFEFEEISVETSGSPAERYRLSLDEEQVFLYFLFADGARIYTDTFRDIGSIPVFGSNIEFLSDFDNVILFTARRVG